MKIDLVFDASVSNAPAGFSTALTAAADYLDNLIADPITVNIQVGWGENNGQPIGGSLATGGPFIYGQGFTYAQVKGALAANADSAADALALAHLPAADPTGGGTFFLAAAQEKAFGLMPADGKEIDGTVGFSDTVPWATYPSSRGVAGEFDLVGVAEHELTHALGRIYGLGTLLGPGRDTVLDLFRYAAPATPELGGGEPAYFSIDGGTTELAQFEPTDAADWTAAAAPDAFDAAIPPGVEEQVTPRDITVMDVIGFAVTPCFLAGSRVLTPEDERAVERLRVGERVLTAEGRAAPIVWIGERRIDCRFHPAPEKVWPVRIRAGAFAAGEPRRDLLLSPDHAVFVAGVLIPVKHLVNGASIVQEEVASARYVHIELDRHDILLAERLAVESYLDTGNRALFAHGAGVGWPAAPGREAGCAPFCTTGPAVFGMRRHLLARAPQFGYRRGAGSPFRVLTETGEALACNWVEGHRPRFVVPSGTRELRLVGPTAVPAWFDPESEDWRRLGASIGGIWIDGAPVPLESPVLAAGFYGIECRGPLRWRWTDGDARLAVGSGGRGGASSTLDVLVLAVVPSWRSEPADPCTAEAA